MERRTAWRKCSSYQRCSTCRQELYSERICPERIQKLHSFGFQQSKFQHQSIIRRLFGRLGYILHVSKQLYQHPTLSTRVYHIFDEVQLFPRARTAIKYLVEDGRYDYIETGSLVSIKKNVENIMIPSEEDEILMYPMDFEEFLWALGNETLMPLICMNFEKSTRWGK